MIFSLIFLLLFCGGSAFPIDVDSILDRSDEISHPENLQGSFTMTLTSRTGDTRTIKVDAYQKRSSESREDRLFLFTFPPSVEGTGLLVNSSSVSFDGWVFDEDSGINRTRLMAYFDNESRNWITEPGTYTLYAGFSSGDIRQVSEFRIK